VRETAFIACHGSLSEIAHPQLGLRADAALRMIGQPTPTEELRA
jgi:hypothetical protein